MTSRLIILIAFVVALMPQTFARNAKKPDPTRARASRTPKPISTEIATTDTIAFPAADSVVVSGFEKTLRSTSESMIVTNNTVDTITAIGLDISYLDMSDRMLHRSTHTIVPPDGTLPPGESRMLSLKSFDRQGLFYYHLSPRPKRTLRATPFKVKVTVNYICIPKKPI